MLRFAPFDRRPRPHRAGAAAPRRHWRAARWAAAGLAWLSLGAAAADPVLLTVGPDAASFAPQVLTRLSAGVPVAATPLAPLGDGSIGYTGGLAYDAGLNRLYAIGSDSAGDSTLVRMAPDGSGQVAVGALGAGFNGGLALDAATQTLYAVQNDSAGDSTLVRLGLDASTTALGTIGTGFYGGLTWGDGVLLGLAGDPSGVVRDLYRIDPTTLATSFLFSLGDGSLGFDGGLAWDAAAARVWVIGNDALAQSTLYTVSLGAGGSDLVAVDAAFGSGYVNAGLTWLTSPVPEPATALLLLPGGAVLALARRRSQRRPVPPAAA